MIKWLGKKQPETRSSFTQQVVEAWHAASLLEASDIAATSAARAGVGWLSRVFSLAEVEPAELRQTVTPDYLRRVMCGLLTRGEHVAALILQGSQFSLRTATTWRVSGSSSDPQTWTYAMSFVTPSGNDEELTTSARAVVHPRYASDIEPWTGVSPLSGLITADTLATIETSLRNEVSAPVGQLLHVAGLEAADDDTVSAFRRIVATLKGGVALTPANTGLTDSRDSNTAGSAFQTTRIGASPNRELVELRRDASESIYAALGVKPSLFEKTTDGQSLREAARLAGVNVLEPTALHVASALSQAFEVDVTLDLHRAWLADLRTRSQIARALSESAEAMGMDAGEIRAASGF